MHACPLEFVRSEIYHAENGCLRTRRTAATWQGQSSPRFKFGVVRKSCSDGQFSEATMGAAASGRTIAVNASSEAQS